jgi:putative hydroxymethylpyrimidine transport system substrate-binding protein
MGKTPMKAKPIPPELPEFRSRNSGLYSILAVAVALALGLALAACGEKSETTPTGVKLHNFDVELDWFPNADHVALYQALDRGYFRDVGLNVRPHVPSDPAAPIKQAAAGRVDIAISYEPEVFLARQQDLPVVAVAALIQRPLTSLMAIVSKKVRSPRDLNGKRVGTAGIPYQTAYLKTILRRARIPSSSVKVTNVGASLLPAMLSGKVDATLGAFSNVEGVELQQRGKHPTIIPVNRLGVPDYDELVLVASEKAVREQKDDLRLFIAALARGAELARKDPRGATNALLRANPDLKRKLTRASVSATIPALFPRQSGRPWGFLDSRQWRNYGVWMREQQVLKKAPDPAATFTNDLLPGEGL